MNERSKWKFLEKERRAVLNLQMQAGVFLTASSWPVFIVNQQSNLVNFEEFICSQQISPFPLCQGKKVSQSKHKTNKKAKNEWGSLMLTLCHIKDGEAG
jgi:hypothetical protein